MGSSGQKKSRKTHKKPQHLAKVGTKAGTDAEMKARRRAVADGMGIGGAPPWVRYTALVVVVLLILGAIGGLIVLTALD